MTMTTAVEFKRYNDLLDALAEFIKVNGDPAGLDAFLTGYAGKDWKRAKAAAGKGGGKTSTRVEH
jgi:hypothetical protein